MSTQLPPAYTAKNESKLETGLLRNENVTSHQSRYSTRCRIFIALFVALFLSGFGVFFAVGSDTSWALCQQGFDSMKSLPESLHQHDKRQSLWQPSIGTKWDYRLGTTSISNISDGIKVLGVDLFDVKKTQIDTLHSKGIKAICYFSAGTAENWRSDYKSFAKSDIGKGLKDWKGEKYVNIRNSTVRTIMTQRIDMAVTKGCDGIDPDNVDIYTNANGIIPKLTAADGASYVNYLADYAKSKGLSVGLKNAPEIINSVISNMQWAVVEECHTEGNCASYQPFIAAGKPVFNVEYPTKSDKVQSKVLSSKLPKYCADSTNISKSFSIILKKLDLDSWIQFCS